MIQANTNNRWARLSQSEKAELLGIYASKGYHDLANIIAHYNSCGGKLYPDGGPENGLFTPNKQQLPKELIPEVPMKVGDFGYDENGNVIIQGFSNIDKDIQEGNWLLYQKDYRNAPGIKYYRNKETGEYFRYNEPFNPSLNLDDYEEVSPNDIRKMLPKRDYIGGDNYRLDTVKRVPGLLEMIKSKADAYGINPNLMLHRFMKEGIVDQWVNSYNNAGYMDQKTFFNNLLNQEVAGYGALGLDDAGSNLLQGLYELKDPTATWQESDNINEQGRPVKSVTVPNMNSGLEIKAADMAYRKKELEKRGLTGDDYINAAYNMGLYNKKLNDPEFIESAYNVPDYGVFKSGGKIYIKPENRGKFTALKKRTGHSASWFKEHGTPAQKKMAVFALNARKWKHADGGPLGEENETQVNYIPNWTVFGTDYSTWKPSDIQSIIDWGYTDPESFFGEEGENTRNALSRAGMADSVIGDIYANMDPELQSKFGDRYKGTKQRQQEYTGGITNAIDSAGQRIYQIADTVAGFVPGPVGMIDWLGHMGADAVEGEFGKVGKDLALAAGLGFGARALGKGVRYLKGYWDEIGNFGEDTFRAFIDGVPDRVSTNFTYAAPSTRAIAKAVPAVSKTASTPYEIENLGGGYMLKSLMRGNPLEKQISKNGTVNVNNVRALANKGSKVEQAVIDKVLSSEEFAGQKAIDYNKFRKAVQDELISYKRSDNGIANQSYADYGMERLGFEVEPDPASSTLPGYIDGVKTDVVLYESPRIPIGNDTHYNTNTLGHARTYTTSEEPDILHVIESQSDWGQNYKKLRTEGEYNEKRINSLKRRIERLKKAISDERRRLAEGKRIDGTDMYPYEESQLEAIIENDEQMLDGSMRELFFRENPREVAQQDYLADNFTSRQIQENLRYASERGQTKMRYPTRDTAAKIEGYSKSRYGVFELEPELRAKYDDFMASRQQKVNDIIRESAPEGYIDDYLQRWEEIPDEAIEVMDEAQKADLQRRSKLSWDFEKSDAGAEMKRKINEVYRKYDEQKWLNENVPATYLPEHETILRKYDAFPKQFQKLFKGADIRTVTDPKGNTWYEVDVPENYLQQEWAYKYGGLLQKYADFSGLF